MPFASNTSHQVEALKLVILTGLRPFFVHVLLYIQANIDCMPSGSKFPANVRVQWSDDSVLLREDA